MIPARLESTRLPGKMLLDVSGKPLIQRVIECANKSEARSVVVATDSPDIQNVVQSYGGQVVMTSVSHTNGTDRLAEATQILGLDENSIVVNLQGDEPDMPVSVINKLARALQLTDAPVATVCTKISNQEEASDASVVKVVCNKDLYALYFSRATIPFGRETNSDKLGHLLRHIGIYAYRVGYLRTISSRSVCVLEQTEQLEQLRVLWWGDKIKVIETDIAPSPGVDTYEDLQRVRKVFAK